VRRPKTSPRTLRRCVSAIVGLCLLDKLDPVEFITQAVRDDVARRLKAREGR
jgi:hypothetical protein